MSFLCRQFSHPGCNNATYIFDATIQYNALLRCNCFVYSTLIWPRRGLLFINWNITFWATCGSLQLLSIWCPIYTWTANRQWEENNIKVIYCMSITVSGKNYVYAAYCISINVDQDQPSVYKTRLFSDIWQKTCHCLFACWGRGQQKLKLVGCVRHVNTVSYLHDRTCQNGHWVPNSN